MTDPSGDAGGRRLTTEELADARPRAGISPGTGHSGATLAYPGETEPGSVDPIAHTGSGSADYRPVATDPAATTAAGTGAAGTDADREAQPDGTGELLAGDQRDRMGRRWQEVQAAFVDEPRQAVQEADALVAELMQELAQLFAAERHRLEGQWSRGDQVSTEELRVSLQRYRSFFQRLLSV
jgi:hypothetical protein